MIGPFCPRDCICLNIGFCQLCYGKDASSILALSTKKQYSSFLKKVFVFQKTCFKVKVLKTFETCLSDKNMPISQTEAYFENLLCRFFRRTYALSVGFKMKTLRRAFSNVKTKTNSSFAGRVTERSNHSFLLSI